MQIRWNNCKTNWVTWHESDEAENTEFKNKVTLRSLGWMREPNPVSLSSTLLTDCYLLKTLLMQTCAQKSTHSQSVLSCWGLRLIPGFGLPGELRCSSRGEVVAPALSPTANYQLRGLLVQARLGLLRQPANGKVINHLLDLLHVILEAIIALPQGVVLQVEQAETRVQLVDEVGDADWPVVVPRCYAVYCQPWLKGHNSMSWRQILYSWW